MKRTILSTRATALIAVTALAVLAGGITPASSAPTTSNPIPSVLSLPRPTGPYPVGVRSASVSDPSRIDEQTGRPRRLPIRVWYPAQHAGGRAAPYVSPAVQPIVEAVVGLPAGMLGIDTHAAQNVRARRSVAGVVLVQHGGGTLAAFQTGQVVDLASRGYAVVTMDHPHESIIVEEPDGTLIHGVENAETIPFQERLLDADVVLDALPRLVPEAWRNTPIAMFGHSRGGAATAEVMYHHPEVVAGVDLDGSPRGDVIAAGLDRPLGFMLSRIFDPDDPGLVDFLSKLRGPHPLRQLDVLHYGYTDWVVFNPQANRADPALGTHLEQLLSTGTTDDLRHGQYALAAQRQFVARFMARYLTRATDASTGGYQTRAASSPAYKIDFSPCPGSTTARCGTLRVPADWSRPNGSKIDVAVARHAAEDPAHRIGTLFFNPGGPGDSGVKYVVAADTFFSATLRARFDIVSVDPRGVGASTPITCGVAALTPDYTFFPKTQHEFDAMVAHNRAVANSCLEQTGPLMLNADTRSVARDHEALRIALGVSKVNWLGLSYGSHLGAQYAELYPDRTRAMVLDAATEHSGSETSLTADGISTVEEAFNRFADWCDTADDCALHGQDVAAVYDRLVESADQHPIPVEGALRPVTGDDILMNTPNWLVAKTPNAIAGELSWPVFSEVLRRAVAGDAQYFAFGPPAGPTDFLYSRIANHCGDYVSDIRTFADMQRRIEMGRQLAPHLKGASEFWQGGLCIGYPLKVANPQRTMDVKGVPTLVVHATHDPSVSYKWAFSLAAQIRGSSVLSRVGDGHTSYYTPDGARDAPARDLVPTRSPAAPVAPR